MLKHDLRSMLNNNPSAGVPDDNQSYAGSILGADKVSLGKSINHSNNLGNTGGLTSPYNVFTQ